jgi:hypothetical protein
MVNRLGIDRCDGVEGNFGTCETIFGNTNTSTVPVAPKPIHLINLRRSIEIKRSCSSSD